MTDLDSHDEPAAQDGDAAEDAKAPPRFRLSVGIGLAIFTSVALAAIGALNHAAVGAESAVQHATRVIEGKGTAATGDTSGSAQYRAQTLVAVCHNGTTSHVSRALVPAHLARGDTLGFCR
jgi:hypothetical protein